MYKRKNLVLCAIVLLCFFLPEVEAQLAFGTVQTYTESYHISIGDVEKDTTYEAENIFVGLTDGCEKPLKELTKEQLIYAVRFILRKWDEDTKREYEYLQRIYKQRLSR